MQTHQTQLVTEQVLRAERQDSETQLDLVRFIQIVWWMSRQRPYCQ